MFARPPSSSREVASPAQDAVAVLAGQCRQEGLPGLFWLDARAGGTDARSLLAACPDKVRTGEPAEWEDFQSELAAFQKDHPDGAVAGWIEYTGKFKFGFYRTALFFHHQAGVWMFPGGRPQWLPEALGHQAATTAWTHAMAFRFETLREEFQRWVRLAQEHIAAGDIYQVNLAHRASAPWPDDADAFALYLSLRAASPAPQATFAALDGTRTILCASPEEFLSFQHRRVRTRPIKGTRPRGASAAEDAVAAAGLLASEKERAELLMITDLLRNDLGQFCEFGSVRVEELFRLERFAQVFHLVSTVTGRLRPDTVHAAALRMCLPGGSITGAPKRRAREIIAKLETAPRGLYTGCIGAFLPQGESRFNIAIRTLIVENGEAHFHVGAGIVADSDPQAEWEETLHKAAGILRAGGAEPPS